MCACNLDTRACTGLDNLRQVLSGGSCMDSLCLCVCPSSLSVLHVYNQPPRWPSG